jgi:CRISPR-associated protein Cmr3
VNENWKAFRLVPHDVLFFRDGKPSTRGADHYLRSLFPPYPSTLYGAVRTRRLLDAGVALEGLNNDTWSARLKGLETELGPWGGFGALEIRGPWMVRDTEALVPAPADLAIVLGKSEGPESADEAPRIETVGRFRTGGAGERSWSHPLDLLFPFLPEGDGWRLWKAAGAGEEPRSAAGDWFLTPRGLAAWRRGGVPDAADFVHRRELWRDEPRTGLGLDAHRRSGAAGMLYTFGFVRVERRVGIGFEARNTELGQDGIVRLGGEGRTAALEAGPPFPSDGSQSGARFSLCFATPALSAAGGYPPGFALDAEGKVLGALGGLPCRLVAAVLPRFAFIGGWDLAARRPKPLRRAIPPGSVFLFEREDGGTLPLAEIDGRCFSDFADDHLARQGFGLAVAGVSR